MGVAGLDRQNYVWMNLKSAEWPGGKISGFSLVFDWQGRGGGGVCGAGKLENVWIKSELSEWGTHIGSQGHSVACLNY